MQEEFIKRNLNKTIEALGKLGCREFSTGRNDSQEILAITYQNTNRHRLAYTSLSCKYSSKFIDKIAFCSCCGSVKNFLRNFSLFESSKIKDIPIIKEKNFLSDPFTDYLECLINKNKDLILNIINTIPLFWEAYLLLAEVTETFVYVEGPLSSYFYMHLKILKDIDPPGYSPDYISGCKPILTNLPYQIEKRDKNLLAAFFYANGNKDESLNVFLEIININQPNAIIASIEYCDFLAALLYSRNDKRLENIVELMKNQFENAPETLAAVGILKTSQEQYNEAKCYFKKSLKSRDSPDVWCMLGHCFALLKDKESAAKAFRNALKSVNFRIFYSVAQGYFILEDFLQSLFYCQKSLDLRNDGSVWKLMGRIYYNINNFNKSMFCLEKALDFKEYDALLYMADVYKKTKKIGSAISAYEKYVLVGEKNKEIVIKHLIEHFEELGNSEKALFYKNKI